MKDLKQRTLHGGLAKVCSQAANFLIRIGSLMIMARLLDPKDFGLVGMVTAVIGVFSVFKDFGLSTATVQRTNVTEDQISTLFWVNILVGLALAVLAVVMAPVVVIFYHEPRLLPVTAFMATGFLFNAAGVQHCAIMERQMRFTALSFIDILSLLTSTGVGIGMAMLGYGYRALVATTIVTPLIYTICVWAITGWVPGRPRRCVDIRSMMRFGGTLTLNGFVMYVASNFEKVLLGRFWGADAIGLYGRAYQLISIPTDNLNSSAGVVAFAALSRLQDQPERMKHCFLKGYSLVLSMTAPIAFAGALFGDDTIAVFLGPKWKGAATVFRLLAPTTLVFAAVNPLGWLLSSLGLVGRGLKIALVLAPIMIAGYSLGLPYGPKGVAVGYSAVMMLCLLPLTAWAIHGTIISFREVLVVLSRPIFSGLVAGAVAFGLQLFYGSLLSPLLRLALGTAIFGSVYLAMLLYAMGQKMFYQDVLQGFAKRPSAAAEIPVSA